MDVLSFFFSDMLFWFIAPEAPTTTSCDDTVDRSGKPIGG
jgi:hypothetical protein